MHKERKRWKPVKGKMDKVRSMLFATRTELFSWVHVQSNKFMHIQGNESENGSCLVVGLGLDIYLQWEFRDPEEVCYASVIVQVVAFCKGNSISGWSSGHRNLNYHAVQAE